MIILSIIAVASMIYLGLLVGFSELRTRFDDLSRITLGWLLMMPVIFVYIPARAIIKKAYTPLKMTLIRPEQVAVICLTVVDRTLLEVQAKKVKAQKKKETTKLILNKNIDKSFDDCLAFAH